MICRVDALTVHTMRSFIHDRIQIVVRMQLNSLQIDRTSKNTVNTENIQKLNVMLRELLTHEMLDKRFYKQHPHDKVTVSSEMIRMMRSLEIVNSEHVDGGCNSVKQ